MKVQNTDPYFLVHCVLCKKGKAAVNRTRMVEVFLAEEYARTVEASSCSLASLFFLNMGI
jgi:hypothetical protein